MIKSGDLVSKFQFALDNKWGYIWGSSGQLWTAASQKATTNAMAMEYGSRWIGHRVADCSGLFSWAAAQLGGYLPHGSNSIFRKYCTETGNNMSNLEPGTAVFKRREGTKYADGIDWYHIGLYVGNGTVIEAKSTKAGVVTSKLSDWHAWGRLKGVSYDSTAPEDTQLQPGPAVVDVPNDGTVRVRAKPSTSGQVLATLPEGRQVMIEAVEGDWCKVSYTETGYIMSTFLRGGESDV